MKKQWLTLMFLVLMAGLLVACGGDDAQDTTTDDGANNTTDTADDEVVDIKAYNWEFDQDTYTVAAGYPLELAPVTNIEAADGDEKSMSSKSV